MTVPGSMTFVLVHGGWHGRWCWRKLTPLLRAAGHRVHCPTLTGLGDRAHLADPAVVLDTHVQDVVALLEGEDLRDLMLVGHSSSGAVITGAATRVPDRLRRLVYLDAFVPDPGQSVLDLLPTARREFLEGRARDHGMGWLVPLDGDAAMDSWGVTDPRDRAWMRPRLVPQPLAALHQPLRARPAPGIPSAYLHCVEGPMPATFEPFAQRALADPQRWTLHRLDTGHDAMITMPQELAELFLGLPDPRPLTRSSAR